MPAAKQVAVFFAHGSPMAAIEETDPYAAAVREFGRSRPRPRAIVMISAHWQERRPVRVTAWKSRPVIHDFSGFPEQLYRLSYPAPGDEGLAAKIVAMLGDAAALDRERGLDHGAWVPLRYAWPEADVPVLQVSLPAGANPRELFDLGRRLRPLREGNVLVAGSGGIVHNLRRVVFHDKQAPVEAWAAEFDGWVAERLDGRFEELLDYRTEAPHASLAVPTTEHFDPMLCVLGAAFGGEQVRSFYDAFQYGNLSMRCFSIA